VSSYKLNITNGSDIGFNARYDNLAKAKKPEIVAKTSTGTEVKYKTLYQGKVLGQGSTQKAWVDDQGQQYGKDELSFFAGDQEVSELSQTKQFTIEGYQPEANYTDNYIISAYYEVYADDDGMKKDIDRQRAVKRNQSQMYKLWDYLRQTKQVARGEFCPASRGFVASDGYVRAVEINGKWGLEIGVFKEEKAFQHLQEGKPDDVPMPKPKATGRIKLV